MRSSYAAAEEEEAAAARPLLVTAALVSASTTPATCTRLVGRWLRLRDARRWLHRARALPRHARWLPLRAGRGRAASGAWRRQTGRAGNNGVVRAAASTAAAAAAAAALHLPRAAAGAGEAEGEAWRLRRLDRQDRVVMIFIIFGRASRLREARVRGRLAVDALDHVERRHEQQAQLARAARGTRRAHHSGVAQARVRRGAGRTLAHEGDEAVVDQVLHDAALARVLSLASSASARSWRRWVGERMGRKPP